MIFFILIFIYISRMRTKLASDSFHCEDAQNLLEKRWKWNNRILYKHRANDKGKHMKSIRNNTIQFYCYCILVVPIKTISNKDKITLFNYSLHKRFKHFSSITLDKYYFTFLLTKTLGPKQFL